MEVINNKSKRIRIEIGDVFVIPLRTKGYGVGLVVRKSGKLLLGYFWEIKFENIPLDFDFSILKEEGAFLISMFNDLGFKKSDWHILGKMPNFNFKDWRIPKFLSETKPFGKKLRTYNDNLDLIHSESLLGDEDKFYHKDVTAGYGSIELKLSRQIDGML